MVTGNIFTLAKFEQSTVRVGEGAKFGVEVGVALVGRRVERLEKAKEPFTEKRRGGCLYETAETVLRKDVGVFGVEAEHQPHTQTIERGKIIAFAAWSLGVLEAWR